MLELVSEHNSINKQSPDYKKSKIFQQEMLELVSEHISISRALTTRNRKSFNVYPLFQLFLDLNNLENASKNKLPQDPKFQDPKLTLDNQEII